MSSDRLKELQRQRALAQEQLAWFDREIARETGPASAVSRQPTPGPAPVTPTADTDEETARLIAQFQENSRPIQNEVRRGCFLYFFAAFAVVGLAVAALWFFRSGPR